MFDREIGQLLKVANELLEVQRARYILQRDRDERDKTLLARLESGELLKTVLEQVRDVEQRRDGESETFIPTAPPLRSGECALCGCDEEHPCGMPLIGGAVAPCSWANDAHTLCSRCADLLAVTEIETEKAPAPTSATVTPIRGEGGAS